MHYVFKNIYKTLLLAAEELADALACMLAVATLLVSLTVAAFAMPFLPHTFPWV